MSRPGSITLRAGIALVLGITAGIAFSSPAAAHSAIIDSSPEAGEVIASAPDFFSVTANEDLADITGAGEGFALEVLHMPTGERIATGELRIDGPTLSTPGVPLASGEYLMRYQVVSADGHPISGEIPFTVAGDVPSAGPGGDPVDAAPIAEPPNWPAWLAGALALAIALAAIVWVVARRRRP